jgi:predicted  nucleic acid-binding Zn-ribbon protein
MSVTEQLLRVFRVDQQLRGLQSRLQAAQKFLDEQEKQLSQIDAKREALNSQMRQLQAVAGDNEGEMKRLDSRIELLREQMNSAKTNKEYKAFLTEVNTLKADRSQYETVALEHMTKIDELKKQVDALDAQRADREKVKGVAADDRTKKADEIKDRLAELEAQRAELASKVPPQAMTLYKEMVRQKGDEAMAPIEELDRRRHEYTCSSCQMAIPVETLSALLRPSSANVPLTRCVSCGAILYLETEMAERLQGGGGGKKSKKAEANAEL